MTTTTSLTSAELNIARSLGISAEKFAAQKVAQHTRENAAESGEDATQTVFRTLGIKQDELPQARMTRNDAGGDKQLSENLIDLIHNIDLASRTHLQRNGSPSLALMCASQLARDLQVRLIGANASSVDQGDGGDLAMLGKVSSHARMPGKNTR